MSVWRVFITVPIEPKSVSTLLEALNVCVLEDTGRKVGCVMVCDLSDVYRNVVVFMAHSL